MNQLRRPALLFLILCLLCSLAAGVLALRRVEVEQAQKSVCFLLSYEDLSLLSNASGESQKLWCSTLARAGLKGILLTTKQYEDPMISDLVRNAGLTPIHVGGLADGGMYVPSLHYDMSTHKENPGAVVYATEPLPLDQILASLNESDSLFVLVEKEDQTGNLLPEGMNTNDYTGRIAKGYWLNRWCQNSFGRLGYSGTEETENILFRTVVDRGIQVLWIAPIYTESSVLVTDRFVYASLLFRLETRLNEIGYCFEIPAGYEPYEPSFALLYVTGLAVLLACLLLLQHLFPLPTWLLYALLGLAALENAAGFWFARNMQITVLALAASVCYPCLSVVLLCAYAERCTQKKHALWRSALCVLLCFGVALLGGVVIGALQSSRDYLLVLRMFRGVKLSQFAVYFFAIAYLSLRLFHQKGRSLRGDVAALFGGFRTKLIPVLLVLVVFCAGLIYLLRTGDRMISVSDFEQRARSWLEQLLYFRPRTKEFLLAWPSVGIALFFASHNKRILCWLFGIFSAVGFASVANTFCHSRAHFLVSLARTGYGFVIGMVLCLILYWFLELIWKKLKQEAARKAGNAEA